MKLKSFGVLSMGINMGAYGALIGLFAGAIFALVSMMGGFAMPDGQGGGAAMAAGMGLASIIVLPLLYGIGGFIGGLISALIMNVVFKVTGGLELNFDQ
ncbi:MAG: hypothetical protein KDI75_11215 [Xanthomonadales bacterium]|nr:hypothetical protein [Xanthomonadales bacterium]